MYYIIAAQMRLAPRGGLTRALVTNSIALAAMVIVAALVASTAACRGTTRFFRQYEYEEELYLSLDGTATLYVNSSIAALDVLRGATFDAEMVTANDIKRYFTAPGLDVTRVTFSRRNRRRYVHVRMQVADVQRLGRTPQFGWSSYHFARDGDVYVYRQVVGVPARSAGRAPAWQGDEVVGFRLHIPSKVVYHNVDQVRRGNILAWEQSLADRLDGRPIEMEARMQTQSILYRTLGLFGVTILFVAATFGGVLWWLVRGRGRQTAASKPQAGSRA